MQYALLIKIYARQPYPEESLSHQEALILDECLRRKWVCFTSRGNIVVTRRGESAILEHEYDLKKQTEQKAQQERERVRAGSLRRVEQTNAERLSWVQWFASIAVDVIRSILRTLFHL